MANDYVWGVDAAADLNQDLSPVQDSYDYNESAGYYWDDSWDDTWDDEFDYKFDYSADNPTQAPADAVSDPYQVQDVQTTTDPEAETVESSSNNWFSGIADSAKTFAGTDLGKQVISGGISGLGTAIMKSMNDDAAEKRAREDRAFKEDQARIQREHELKLKALASGGSGGPGPATTEATTSSLDQNIIKAR